MNRPYVPVLSRRSGEGRSACAIAAGNLEVNAHKPRKGATRSPCGLPQGERISEAISEPHTHHQPRAPANAG